MKSITGFLSCSNMTVKIPQNKMPIGEIDFDEVHTTLKS